MILLDNFLHPEEQVSINSKMAVATQADISSELIVLVIPNQHQQTVPSHTNRPGQAEARSHSSVG